MNAIDISKPSHFPTFDYAKLTRPAWWAGYVPTDGDREEEKMITNMRKKMEEEKMKMDMLEEDKKLITKIKMDMEEEKKMITKMRKKMEPE